MERRNIFSASTKRTREKINYILKVILTASIRFDEGQCGHVRLNRIRAEPHKENENESIRRNEFLGPPTADAACADLDPVVPAYHHRPYCRRCKCRFSSGGPCLSSPLLRCLLSSLLSPPPTTVPFKTYD